MKIIMNNTSKITCPTCGKTNTWLSENQFRPFCSDRCKLIDLGEWANESRKIPVEEGHLLPIDEDEDGSF